MENTELINLIGHDLYNCIQGVNQKQHPLTEKMEEFCIDVFYLDDRRHEKLKYTMDQIIDILEETKPYIDYISDKLYFRASLTRIKELYDNGYDQAEKVYKEKLLAIHNSCLGATNEEFLDAFNLINSILP